MEGFPDDCSRHRLVRPKLLGADHRLRELEWRDRGGKVDVLHGDDGGRPVQRGGQFHKGGFETVASVSTGFAPYVFAVAANAGGVVLGITEQVKTFVPVEGLECAEMMCPVGTDYKDASNSMAGSC